MPDSSEQLSGEGLSQEKRCGARRDIRTIGYVELGDTNGGTVLNVSEGGLAIATAQPVTGSQFPKIHFRLPELGPEIQAAGEITWISNSKKRAGMRFVNLPVETRGQIKDWMLAEQNSDAVAGGDRGPAHIGSGREEESRMRAGVDSNRDRIGEPTEQPRHNDEQRGAITPEVRDFVQALDLLLAKSGIAESGALISELSETERDGNEAESLETTESARGRRSTPRVRVAELAYVEVGVNNGGALVDLSENGACLRAARVLDDESSLQLRFRVPGGEEWIAAQGTIIWKGKTEKTAGVQFHELGRVDRERIEAWKSREIAKLAELPKNRVGIARERPGVYAPDFHENHAREENEQEEPKGVFERPGSIPAVYPGARRQSRFGTAVLTPTQALTPGSRQGFHLSALQSAVPAAPGKTPVKWWLFAAIGGLIGGVCFAAGMAFGPHAPGGEVLKETASQAVERPQTIKQEATASGKAAEDEPASLANAGGGTSEPALTQRDGGPQNTKSGSLNSSISTDPSSAEVSSPKLPLSFKSLGKQQSIEPRLAIKGSRPVLGSQPQQKRAAGAVTTSISGPQQKSVSVDDAASPKGHNNEQPPDATGQSDLTGRDNAAPAVQPAENAGNREPESEKSGNAAAADQAVTGAGAAATAKNAEEALPSHLNQSPGAAGVATDVAPATDHKVEALSGTVSSTTLFRSIRGWAEMSSSGAQGGQPLQIGGLVSGVPPAYPPEALAEQLQGRVELRVAVRRDGTVQDVQVVNGPVALATAAMRAVSAWRFEQTLFGGQPVETDRAIVMVFALKGSVSPH